MNQQQDFADLAARQIVGDNGYANASYREAKVGEVATLIRECYSRKPPTLSLLGLTQEEREALEWAIRQAEFYVSAQEIKQTLTALLTRLSQQGSGTGK
jgi:hypothetical protein